MLRTLREKISAREALRVVLVGGFLLMLAANLPGHLSVDSIAQLYEGRMQVRETFGPVVYSRILGLFDRIVPGTGLYVVASALLLIASLLSLRDLRPRVSFLAVPVAAFVVLTPDFMVYQGIVWKDVLFANLAVAGFVALAHAARRWDQRLPRWIALLAALLLLALAATIRQNGLVAAAVGAVAIGWIARGGGVRASLAYGLGALLAVLLLAQGLNVVSQPKSAGPDNATDIGLRILQHYDIVAGASIDASLPLAHIDKARPASDDFIRSVADQVYSPERVDFFDRVPDLGKHLWPVPPEAIRAEWKDLILEHPQTYLAHRWGAFRWVFLTPDVGRCVPLHVGVDGPAVKVAALKLTVGTDPADLALYGYAARFFKTPVYSHLSYAIMAVLVSGILLLRRDPADMAIVGLQLAALGFAASFFVISLACDYRYIYFLDMAAMTGLLYLAIDPPIGRARKGAASV